MPNGKVDRALLPAPAMWVRSRARPAADRPRARTSRRSGRTCSAPGAIGIDDNVFELGAHSLMAAKVHRRIQELLVVQWMGAGASAPASLAARIQRQVRDLVADAFPLRAVFDYPTVRTLAASVSGGSDHPAGPSDPEAASPRESGSRRRRAKSRMRSHRSRSSSVIPRRTPSADLAAAAPGSDRQRLQHRVSVAARRGARRVRARARAPGRWSLGTSRCGRRSMSCRTAS